MTKLAFRALPHFEGLSLPRYESAEAAGMDVRAANDADEPIILKANGGRALVPTGLTMALEAGFEAQMRPRSGLAFKHGVTVLNSPGTIDSDYRGELKIILINHGDEDFVIERGMRIGQMIIAPVLQVEVVEVVEVDALPDSVRGSGGFGSTGKH
ncbi:dUTP diphosphatase [Cohaesibacter gelatinilyticus]|uniref:Deoxyuridine 5'-triphosphate nucleotidohydrolase n=1 Tax=Cohaesibacter gelatinilyticus TaxID=372072 RepID=A0A285PFC4_9HYPH|nr:dUTP diphosphatase [Cohaesibacter gelatinilyticus]SNZ20003.1 dUTP pyrophosphatase [Cohaesibacter gelatinilyticus]